MCHGQIDVDKLIVSPPTGVVFFDQKGFQGYCKYSFFVFEIEEKNICFEKYMFSSLLMVYFI